MLKTLNFIRGAVATRDLVPVLLSIHAYDGRLQGSNGKLTIDAPCKDLAGYDFTVPCTPFLKAVDACNGEPKLVVSDDKGRLSISKGVFKAMLPLSTHEDFPRQKSEGEVGLNLSGPILPVLRSLSPFISEDASRPWACGVLFRNGYAFAINNIVVAGAPALTFPMSLNLPGFLVDELLRIGMEPTSVLANSDRITFHFANGSWMKSSLLSAEWPAVEKMLPETAPPTTVPEGLLSAVEQIVPFCPDPKQPLIYLGADGVKTSDGDKSATVGGFDLPQSVFRAEPLTAVLRVACAVDFSTYPKPVPWTGISGLRGLIVGVVV